LLINENTILTLLLVLILNVYSIFKNSYKHSACWSCELVRYDELFNFYLVLFNNKIIKDKEF
jgi:hypothetical protein